MALRLKDFFVSISRKLRILPTKLTPREITYEGIFASFDQVYDFYQTSSRYISADSYSKNLEKAFENRGDFLKYGFCVPSWISNRNSLFSIFLSGIQFERLRVLDVGGGFGETYLELKSSIKRKFDYCILEFPRTAIDAQRIYIENPDLRYISNFDDVTFTPDVVYFGSSLQYFEKYQSVLERVAKLNPRYVVISDTPMGDMGTFVCAQVNMPQVVIPRWIFDRHEIVNIFAKLNYKLIHESFLYYPFHNFDNYPLSYRNTYHSNLVFQINSTAARN